jgi:hypothetical protein
MIYRNGDFVRAVTIAHKNQQSRAVYANGRLSFEIDIDPGKAWHFCLFYTLADCDRTFAPPDECVDQHHKSRHAEKLSDWLQSVLNIRTSNEEGSAKNVRLVVYKTSVFIGFSQKASLTFLALPHCHPLHQSIRRQTHTFEEAALAEARRHSPDLRAPGLRHPE